MLKTSVAGFDGSRSPMKEAVGRGFARDRDYRWTLGIAALLGIEVGVLATAFLVGLRHVTEWLWPDASAYGTGFFDGEWWMVGFLAASGLVVGVSAGFSARP